MSILYAPKLFLTNQNFANILETSIKALLYQKIANVKKNEEKCKRNVVLLSQGICELDKCRDQIRYSSRKDMNCRKNDQICEEKSL